jgi:hypothetical protein
MRCTGAPCTATGASITGAAAVGTVAAIGVQCLTAGCGPFSQNTIRAGGASGGVGIGLDLSGASPAFNDNEIDGPTCNNGIIIIGATYYGAHLVDTASVLTNNIIRDGACFIAEDSVHYDKVSATAPTVENNTIEYTTCTGCGQRRGLAIAAGPGGAPGAAGVFRNNIIRNTAAGGVSWVVYESDPSSDLLELANNDLFDPTGTLYFDEGSTNLTTIAMVNALAGASANLNADPLLNLSWHLAAASPCRNTGTATGAPAHDFDNQGRPNEAIVDIGADEFYP